ncbi:MAG: aminotransferase class III-fold pyridoxal phosphate-dependent enzyme, partial [Planctomycetaceae bacterium]
MRLIACQSRTFWHDRLANFRRVGRLLLGAAVVPGSLVVLPEMFATGFSMNLAAAKETESNETEKYLRRLARKRGIFLLGGMASGGADGKAVNEAVAVAPDGDVVARYTKLHPFPLAGEAEYFRAGERTVSFQWQSLKVSPFICYDLRFPEVFRSAALQDVDVFAVLANWPAVRKQHWITLLRARAIENQAYVVGVNRCGADPDHEYSGRSMIVGPAGDVLAEAGAEETVIWADVDPAGLTEYRRRFPFLRDARPEFLGSLAGRAAAVAVNAPAREACGVDAIGACAVPAIREDAEDKVTFDRSNQLVRRLHVVVPGGAHTYAKGDDQYPDGMAPLLVRGKGCEYEDVDGNTFTAYAMGCRSVTLGHCFPAVVDAVKKQLEDGWNLCRPTALELECAEQLLRMVPGAEMVKLGKNGSDVTSAAVRLARAYTGRD